MQDPAFVGQGGEAGRQPDVWHDPYWGQTAANVAVLSPNPVKGVVADANGESTTSKLVGAPVSAFQTNQTDFADKAGGVVQPEAVILEDGANEPQSQQPHSLV